MKLIVSARIPGEATTRLRQHFEVLTFEGNGITYEAVDAHPDVFICAMEGTCMVAPNTPPAVLKAIKQAGIPYVTGAVEVGARYPATSHYNAVVTPTLFIHHLKHTDIHLLKDQIHKRPVHVNQGYTRCNLLALDDRLFITSDRGILSALMAEGVNVHYFPPEGILLPGFDHGFIGGTAGKAGEEVWFMGNPERYPEGRRLTDLIRHEGYSVRMAYDGPLLDVGSLLFFP